MPSFNIPVQNRSAGLFTVFFGLFFSGVTTFILIAILQEEPREDPSETLFGIILASVFILIGLGIMAYGFYSIKFAAREAIRSQELQDRPWLLNKEWAGGRIKDSNALQTIMLGIMALIWNGISWPMLWTIFNDPKADSAARYIILLFPIVGLVLLGLFIYQLARWIRFGCSDFEMAEVPGVIGGTLGGVIHTKVNIRPNDGFRISLQSVRKRVTGSGKSQSTHEEVLWEDQTILEQEALPNDPTRSALPVFFDIPFSCLPTQTISPRESIYWRLTAAAQLPGVDYKAMFVVPVFITPDSRSDGQLPGKTDRQASAEAAQGVRHYQMEQSASGISYTFSGLNHLVLALIPLVIGGGMVFAAIVLALFAGIPWIFPVFLGLFGLFVEFHAINMLTSSTRVSSDKTGLTIEKRKLTGSQRQVFPASQVLAIEPVEGMTVSGVRLYNLEVRLSGESPVRIDAHIKGLHEAKTIAQSLQAF